MDQGRSSLRAAFAVTVESQSSTGQRRASGSLILQLACVLILLAVLAAMGVTAAHNLAKQSISSGFGFLEQEAGFAIGFSLIPFGPIDPYWRALCVGLLNTALVSAVGIILATALGVAVGLAQMARNPLLTALGRFYVESVRNLPLILQLFAWYTILTAAPIPQRAWQMGTHLYLSNRGLSLPFPGMGSPLLGAFNFEGGLTLPPELLALLFGLVIYTASYIAEIVRASVLAVSYGQTEAALALGLSPGTILRRIVMPQAIRIALPTLTSQFLNLTKNSSLAIAIGFPELVAVANTMINQTGQALEGIAIIMVVYLTLSLSLAGGANAYGREGNWRTLNAGSGRHAGNRGRWRDLFASPINLVASVIIGGVALFLLWQLLDWALLHAVWQAPSLRACRQQDSGACWAFIGAQSRFILFGRYPHGEQWRAGIAMALFILTAIIAILPRLPPRLRIGLPLACSLLALLLMEGGFAGLPLVETTLWGGLPLTLLITICSTILGFPLAILLALARRSTLSIPRWVATAFIEAVRGVPLITILFMASLLLPLFLPSDISLPKLLRALIGITLFLAAYLAEDIRGGLRALPIGQDEAGAALGLGKIQRLRFIILPQALMKVLPAIIGTLIGNLKNSALVSIIGLFDVLQSAQSALLDPQWRGADVEAYLFVGLIYFIPCAALSWYGRSLESGGRRNKSVRARPITVTAGEVA